jgi:hypothetical protein
MISGNYMTVNCCCSARKRNAVLDLSEVQRYGRDSYGDTDYVSIYGMRPSDWHSKGARVLGRMHARWIGRCDWQGRRRDGSHLPGHVRDAGSRSVRPAPPTRFIGCCATSRVRRA